MGDFESERLTEVFEIMPRCKVCLAKDHRYRRIGRELVEHVPQQLGEESGVHLYLADQ